MLPKPLSVQMIAGLRAQTLNYESHRKTIAGFNDLVRALQPGDPITPGDFALSPALGSTSKLSAVSGTFRRGKFTVEVSGSGLSANPMIVLNFPKGLFETDPFAQVIRNGGSGALNFSYIESTTGISITLSGTAAVGETYTFQFAVRE